MPYLNRTCLAAAVVITFAVCAVGCQHSRTTTLETAASPAHTIQVAEMTDTSRRGQIASWYREHGNAQVLSNWLANNADTVPSYKRGMPSSLWLLSDDTPLADLELVSSCLSILD